VRAEFRPVTLFAIPSPSTGELDLGPLSIHLYGLTLLVAIAACVWLTARRWGDRTGGLDLVLRVAVWGVAAGIVGARAYHVLTSWDQVPDPKWKGVFMVWEGGLGVWGGIFLGTLVGAWIVRRAGASVFEFMDAVAPGLLLAQGIGRFGNWWNQELYGKETDLPWKLEIDDAHNGDLFGTTYHHPTFLYEMLWNFAGVVMLLVVSSRFRIRPPALFALYVSWYTFGRFFEELLRVDPSHEFAGLRLNAWVSIVLFVISTVFFVWWQFFGGRTPGVRWPLRRRRGEVAEKRRDMAVPRGRVRT
jgi:prolipoprotein diacylglyceryl transferase